MYVYDSKLFLVTTTAETPAGTCMVYVGLAKTYGEAAGLAAKYNEKVTGRKNDCINVRQK